MSEERTEYDAVNPFGIDVDSFRVQMKEAADLDDLSLHQYAQRAYELWDEPIQALSMIPMISGFPLGYFHHELNEVLQVQGLIVEVGSPLSDDDELRLAQVFGNWSFELHGNRKGPSGEA